MRSRSPKGVFTESNAIDPTTTRLIGGADYLAPGGEVGEGTAVIRRSLLIATALAALAMVPAEAQAAFGVTPAAKSFQVGTGGKPEVAVDANGTAHVIWQVTVSGADKADELHYCQVPAGATACSGEKILVAPLDAIGRASYVFTTSDGRVIVETYRCCNNASTGPRPGNYEFESSDGGQTFSQARLIGNLDHQSDAVVGPGNAISGANVALHQQMPLTGAPASTFAELNTGFPGIPTMAAVGIFNGTSPVQVITDGNGHTEFNTLTGSDANSSSTWSGPHPLTPTGDDPVLAGGPAGLVLLYKVGDPAEGRTYVARKFDGTTFGAPVNVSEKGDPIFADLYADPVSGTFHAFWTANGASPNEFRWAYSADGLTWSAPQTVLSDAEPDNAFNLRVAAGPDGKGLAVYDRNGDNDQVRAVPLIPSTGGTPGNDGSATNPADTVTVGGGGQEVTLFTPAECVNPGVKITLRVTSKTKHKLSPKKRVKIVYVVFSVDKKKKKDKKAAFKASFSTKKFKAPSTHKLRAKVRLKPVQGKGKAKTKTLNGSLKICG
jgi:hypothetical protein